MRYITHCPACETQFFVNDEQLNQHEGKVRCGQCLHVFNANEQIIESPQSEISINPADSEQPSNQPDVKPVYASQVESDQPNITNDVIAETPFVSDESDAVPVSAEPFILESNQSSQEYAPTQLDEFLEKRKFKRHHKPVHKGIWILLTFVFVLIAIAQAAYYLRNEIALYYPASKPYLTQVCNYLHCGIELPKKIELIVIDDSDIQEDAEHQGLIWLSSTLINQASFTQALPNLELTLTDVEDQPKLRRIISPKEYLPTKRAFDKGLAPKEELRIRLPIDTKSEVLAGYRVLVTY
jgi:predicted Zn finger-like uncharacterized protein